jgi:hypothetical protein
MVIGWYQLGRTSASSKTGIIRPHVQYLTDDPATFLQDHLGSLIIRRQVRTTISICVTIGRVLFTPSNFPTDRLNLYKVGQLCW